MADDGASRVGTILGGKYRLDERIGAGGMGEVYRAENELIGRTVAIKMLLPEHTKNEEIVQRFVREARAANRMRHPNVVDVLDVDLTEDGTPFLVQEFLIGEDLATRLAAAGKMSVDNVLRVMIPIVDAVSLGHQNGIVHRDLKPENVFLARVSDGRKTSFVPKLLDFGISHMSSATGERQMTLVGQAMGTPAYMSPEQIEGNVAVDPRTDVWAIGIILHELIAGTRPFEAETNGGLFVQICTGTPTPLDVVAPDAPKDVVAIVAMCLRKDRTQRYGTAADLSTALRAAWATLRANGVARESMTNEVALEASASPARTSNSGNLPSAQDVPDVPSLAPPPLPAKRAATTKLAPESRRRQPAASPAAMAPGGDLDLDMFGEAPVNIALDRPMPRVAPAAAPRTKRKAKPVSVFRIAGLTINEVIRAVVVVALALALVVVTVRSRAVPSMPLGPLVMSLYDASLGVVVGAVMAAIGAWLAWSGTRASPKSPGFLIAATGFILAGVIIALGTTSTEGQTNAKMIAPLFLVFANGVTSSAILRRAWVAFGRRRTFFAGLPLLLFGAALLAIAVLLLKNY